MELLTVREAARLMRLSKSQTYALCQRRAIPTIRLGRSVRIPREDLEAWLRRQVRIDEEVGDDFSEDRALDRPAPVRTKTQ
jgi:excisionase family DNA binding protein